MYLWDLGASLGRLLGVLKFQVAQGVVSELTLDIPGEWDVRRVVAEALPGTSIVPRLRDWTLEPVDGRTRLRLVFQTQLTTGVQVFVELLNPKPLQTRTTLALPRPVKAVSTEGLLAYRLENREALLSGNLGLTGIDLDRFVSAWQASGAEDPGQPASAFSFLRSAGSDPSLTLELKEPANRVAAEQEFSYQLGPRSFFFDATMRLTGREEDLILAEWDVPADIVLGEISGADVHGWTRTGNRVQVWFHQAVTKTILTWRGWSAGDRPVQQSWPIPSITCLHASPVETTLHIAPEPGWLVQAGPWTNLHTVAGNTPGLTAIAEQPDYAGAVFLQAQGSAPDPEAAKDLHAPAPADKKIDPAIYVVLEEQGASLMGPAGTTADSTRFWRAGASCAFRRPSAPLSRASCSTARKSRRGARRLVLATGTSVRNLRLFWRWPATEEPADRPNLTAPRLDNVQRLPGDKEDRGWWRAGRAPGNDVPAGE